jgi:hypothetical protein
MLKVKRGTDDDAQSEFLQEAHLVPQVTFVFTQKMNATLGQRRTDTYDY